MRAPQVPDLNGQLSELLGYGVQNRRLRCPRLEPECIKWGVGKGESVAHRGTPQGSGRRRRAELGAEVHSPGKGSRRIDVGEAAAGAGGGEDDLSQTRTRPCFLRRKETVSQEPGVRSQVSTRTGRAHSTQHPTFRGAF